VRVLSTLGARDALKTASEHDSNAAVRALAASELARSD
jgi:hypothetical protein